MANRVVLDQNGLRISKPGVNVLTAPESNLNYSSDWSAFYQVNSGTYTKSFSSSVADSGNDVIPYGTTFPSPPIVIFQWVDSGRYYSLGGSNYFRASRNAALREGTISRGTVSWSLSARGENSGILVSWDWDRKYPQIVIPDFTFRWAVFSYNF